MLPRAVLPPLLRTKYVAFYGQDNVVAFVLDSHFLSYIGPPRRRPRLCMPSHQHRWNPPAMSIVNALILSLVLTLLEISSRRGPARP